MLNRLFHRGAGARSFVEASGGVPEPAVADPAEAERELAERDGAEAGARNGLRLILHRARGLLSHVMNAEGVLEHSLDELEKRSSRLKGSLRSAEERMADGVRFAAHIEEHSRARVEEAGRDISAGLTRFGEEIDGKLTETTEIIGLIDGIASELKLLSINAAIEAAHAEQHGATFSVVAERIRDLAQSTTEHLERVSASLDFDELRASLRELETGTVERLNDMASTVGESTGQIVETFDGISRELDTIKENNNVVFEVLDQNADATQRAFSKSRWTATLLDDAHALLERPVPEMARPMASVVERHHIKADPAYDRLADIRRRGYVRVAVEPSFKGLSFRMREGEPLRGLDVDYARAFADWLGVECRFVEHPWDLCTELLDAGRNESEPEVDLVWTALPPNEAYANVAFSESYTYMPYVLARRTGDTRINGLADLEDRVLGCINDPAAFDTLRAAGVRWGNAPAGSGEVHVGNLLSYTDQSRIHDCLAEGVVDAFAVDRPIYWWACYGEDSPWRGRIEILPGSLAAEPWYYAVGVAREPASYELLRAVNAFIAEFRGRPERERIERCWQGEVTPGSGSYRTEPGELPGEEALRALHAEHARRHRLDDPGAGQSSGLSS